MMKPHLQPPRIAARLVDLFIPAEQAESILGDLHEEFTDIASTLGLVSARAWYWRQTMKTIANPACSIFGSTPLPFFGIVFVGFFLSWFAADLPEKVVVALLRTQRPYSNLHVLAYVRFMTVGIPVARILQSWFIGCLVAALAKGREVLATVTLSVLRGTLMLLLLFLLLTQRVSQWAVLAEFIHYDLALSAVELGVAVVGGVMVRKFRSVAVHRLATS